MKNLSMFIKDEFVKRSIDKLFENCIYVNTIDDAERLASEIGYGKTVNAVFSNSNYKNHFIDELTTSCPDANIINCNCSVDKFFENDFCGVLIFNNLKHCKSTEIIEEINKHNAILLS
jgi:NAD-dependent oxidoreductase involved in siderophore biosynthesis